MAVKIILFRRYKINIEINCIIGFKMWKRSNGMFERAMECAINNMLFRLKFRYCTFQHDFIEFRFIRRLIQIMSASSGPSRPTSALASAQCPRLTTNVVRQWIHSWKQWIRKGIPFCTWVIAGRSLMPLTLMAGQTTWAKKSSPIYWRRKRIRNPWKPRHWTGPLGWSGRTRAMPRSEPIVDQEEKPLARSTLKGFSF